MDFDCRDPRFSWSENARDRLEGEIGRFYSRIEGVLETEIDSRDASRGLTNAVAG